METKQHKKETHTFPMKALAFTAIFSKIDVNSILQELKDEQSLPFPGF